MHSSRQGCSLSVMALSVRVVPVRVRCSSAWEGPKESVEAHAAGSAGSYLVQRGPASDKRSTTVYLPPPTTCPSRNCSQWARVRDEEPSWMS